MSALTSAECKVRFWPHLSWLVTGAEVLEVAVVTEAADKRGLVEVCRGGHTGQHWPPLRGYGAGARPVEDAASDWHPPPS